MIQLLCMAIHPELTEMVVGSCDHGLQVIDLNKLKKKRELYSKRYGHSEWVTSVTYTSDGRILSSGMDSKLCLWDPKAVKCNDLTGHTASVSKVRASSTGSLAVSASYDKSLIVWNLTNGKSLGTRTTHSLKPFVESNKSDGIACLLDCV